MTSEYIPGVDAPDDPWVQLWQKVWDEQGEEGELTNYRIYGMSQAYAFVQALQAAGEDLTRDGLVEALEEAGQDFEGPQLAPYRYTADSHMGISGLRLVEIKKGAGEPLTPVLVTDIGDAEIEEDNSGQAGRTAGERRSRGVAAVSRLGGPTRRRAPGPGAAAPGGCGTSPPPGRRASAAGRAARGPRGCAGHGWRRTPPGR